MVPALGIFPEPNKNPLPWDSYDADRAFWTTSIVPMAGHIVIERLECDEETYVRIVVNGRVQPVQGCDTSSLLGNVGICPLDEFETVVRGRWDTGFCEACAPNHPDCVDKISFYES